MLDSNPADRMGEGARAAGLDYGRAVEEFYQPLYKFALGLAGSENDAADLTQETYQVLLAKGGQIRDSQKLKSWLFTTLYRRFLGRCRHIAQFPKVQVESVEWQLPTVEAATDWSMDVDAAVAALQTLDEKHRAPLVLFYLQELSYREIASALGIRAGTVMSRLSRGKEILRKRLEGEEPGGSVRQRALFSHTGEADSTSDALRASPRAGERLAIRPEARRPWNLPE